MPLEFNSKTYDELKQEVTESIDAQTSNDKFLILPKALPSLPKPASLSHLTDLPQTDQMIGLERSKGRPTGKGFIAVVIDSGVYEHTSFHGAIISRLSAVTNPSKPTRHSPDVTDRFGHGTHMAGIIASREEHNGMGIAPESKIISIKVTEKYGGNATWSSIYRALLQVIKIANGEDTSVDLDKNRIGVVNLSFNGFDNLNSSEHRNNQKIMQAIASLEELNIPVVVSAGNAYKYFSKYGVGYPACNDTCISVGAQFNYDFGSYIPGSLATFSQRISSGSLKKADKDVVLKNSKRFIVAPGACSVSLGLLSEGNKRYSIMSGSSCSAAVVSACILLLQEAGSAVYPDGMPVKLIVKYLMSQCDMDQNKNSLDTHHRFFDNYFYPGINIHKALDALVSNPVII